MGMLLSSLLKINETKNAGIEPASMVYKEDYNMAGQRPAKSLKCNSLL